MYGQHLLPKIRSLKTRFALAIFLIGFVFSGIAVAIIRHEVARRAEMLVNQRMHLVAQMIEDTLRRSDDSQKLQQTVDLLDVSDGMELIMVVGGDPVHVLASTQPEFIGKSLSELPEAEVGEDLRAAYQTGKVGHRFHSRSLEYDLTVPIRSGRDAALDSAVMIHVDAQPIQQMLAADTTLFIAVLLALILLASCIVFLCIRQLVIKPLGKLDLAMRRYAGGEQSVVVDASRHDEIGSLGRTLNEMMHVLTTNRARFQTIFDTASMGIGVIDRAGRLIQTNSALEQLLGYSKEELRALRMATVTHPDDAVEYKNSFQDLVDGITASYQTELRYRRKDGEVAWVALSVSSLPDAEDDKLYLAMLENITQRKQEQQRLHLRYLVTGALEKNRSLQETARDILEHICKTLDWDVAGALTVENEDTPRLECLAQWSKPSLEESEFVLLSSERKFARGEGLPGHVWEIGKPVWIEDVGRDTTITRTQSALRSGLHSALCVPIWFRGTFFGVFEFFSHQIKSPAPELIEMLKTISSQFGLFLEHKREEQELIETLTLQKAILDSANQTIISVTPEGTICAFNQGAQRLLGYAAEEVVGVATPTILHDEEEIACRAKELSRETGQRVEPGMDVFTINSRAGRVEEREWTYVRKDGSRFPVMLSVTALRTSEGAIAGYLGIGSDITERKRTEEELRSAKQVAEDANRAKSEFLANMSHEIRTPMNGILGMTELALGTPLVPEQKEYLETIKDSADALMTIINDILDFSKVEAGKLELDPVEFHLADKLIDTIGALGYRAHQKNLELICHIEPNVPEIVVGDPDRLRQIVINLVGNALKFTEAGEIAVRVERKEFSAQEQQCLLHFSVSDTGIGIPPEKQRLVFDAFAQADGSTSRRFGGTGLGLAIASRLVELMGGQIWVESEVGHGSTFHFTARFGIAHRVSKTVDLSQWEILKDLPVLIVDDNATNRKVLHDMLANWQLCPALASGAQEALMLARAAASRNQPFSLMLIDYLMPEMDGFALAQEICRDPLLAGTTVVMLSSAAEPGFVTRCQEVGIAAFLRKPISQSELLRFILTAFKNRPEPVVAPAELEQPAAVTNPRELKILLAEDNLINQKVAARMLQREGYRVTIAQTGREVLAELEEGAFDLVLMDIQMPEMDGFEATAAIRNQERSTGKHLPIVALTAHAMKGDREQCLQAGMDDYLAKPIDLEILRATIAKVVPTEQESTPPSGAPLCNDLIGSNLGAPKTALPAATAEAPIDLETLRERLGGDTDLLLELLQLFEASSLVHLQEVQQAVANHDSRTLEHVAHTLKGASQSICAEPCARAALQLEKIGSSGNFEQVEQSLDQLKEEVEQLLAALHRQTQGVSS